MNRREFLKMSLALTIGGLTMTADAAENFAAKTIDFHAHAILPAYVAALKRLNIDAAAEEVLENIETLVKAGPDLAMNRINAFRPASAS